MRITTNSEAAHEFYYGLPENNYTFGTNCTFDLNCSEEYKGNKVTGVFYSYYTTIGMTVKPVNSSETYLLISESTMTSTTSKHLSYLRDAFPGSAQNVIQVPFRYGTRMGLYDLNVRINDLIVYALDLDLKRVNNREYIISLYNTVLKTQNLLDFEYDINLFNKLTDKYNEALSINEQKAAKKAQKEAEKQVKRQKELEKLVPEYKNLKLSYSDKIFMYRHKSQYNPLLIGLIENEINPNKNNSFIWFCKDEVHTSQGVRVNKADVVKLLKLWQRNKLSVGMMIDRYTIREVERAYIQVGCHHIPTDNLRALIEQLKKEASNGSEVSENVA